MSTSTHESGGHKSHHGKHVRIVPLHPEHGGPQPVGLAEGKAIAAAHPHLKYMGGPLLEAVEVFTIYWGAAWQQQANADLGNKLNQFFQFILGSALMDEMAEYSVPGHAIKHGKYIGTRTIANSEPGPQVDDSAIQAFLQATLSGDASIPQPSPNRLYFIYLPPGTTAQMQGGQSCAQFCGYHSDINGTTFYALMPYAGCPGCLGSLDTFTALTSTSSHELCEAITDPVVGQGWYWFQDQNDQGEIGDICAWKTKTIGAYTVQLEWSNKHNKCL